MLNIMRRQLERNWIFLLVVMLVLGGFELLICAMVASVDVEGAFGQMTRFAPPFVRAMIEQNLMGGTPAGVLAFGWNHPVVHALLSAVAITLGARAIAGEVENGAIELTLAQPVSRARYFTAHLLFGASALLLASALGREAGRVALAGVLVAVLSFLINAVATLWSKAEFAKPYSLHAYFDPRQLLVSGDLAPSSIAILAAVTAIATVAAFVRFSRRDLP